MIPGKKSLTNALLVMLLGVFSVPLFAQHGHGSMGGSPRQPDTKWQGNQPGMMKVGKKGAMTITSPLRVGNNLLTPGKYVFQHRIVGEDHLLIFEKAGTEIARVTCRLESLDKKAKDTSLYTHVGDTGEVILDAVAVEGESVKHVIPA